MIITRTPFRVSFFGGGTDYPAWHSRHGGAVLAATIDKYCYLTCRYLPPFFEHRFRVVWSRIECVRTIDEIAHPAVRAVLEFLEVRKGLEIHHDGDLPARSGMGSSSAFTVGLLHAVHALQGKAPSRHQLATEGILVEQERLKEPVGSQDQVAAAYGGFNHVRFLPAGEISVQPVMMPAERMEELNDNLMLFYTGIRRPASQSAEARVKDMSRKSHQLRLVQEMVDEALAILRGRSGLLSFGALLHEAWLAKKALSPAISTAEIDAIYECARGAGAIGGKLLGAGGGGFMLLFVPPAAQGRVRARLDGLLHVPFRFEHTGSSVILSEREAEYSDEPALAPPEAARRHLA